MNPYDAWVEQLHREGDVFAAVVLFYLNRGEPPQRARDLAEEAQQEALVRAIRCDPGAYHDYFHFRNSVRQTAIHRAVDAYRKRHRERPLLDGFDLAAPTPEAPSDRSDLVRRCLEQLPDADRRLLEQHFLEGYTLDGLAGLLLPPAGTQNARRLRVWRRVRRAVQRFRTLLLASGIWLPPEAACPKSVP